jgi:hypothetical protein
MSCRSGSYGHTRLVLNIAVGRIHVESVAECSFVPYTDKSLAFLGLITLGLFALTASGVVARSWLPLLLLVALAAPGLILRSQDPVGVIARSRKRPRPSALVEYDYQPSATDAADTIFVDATLFPAHQERERGRFRKRR